MSRAGRIVATVAALAFGPALAEAPEPPVRASGQAGLDLLSEVGEIAERLSKITGGSIEAPVAVHASAEDRDVAIARRIEAYPASDELEARGRAWAEVGLGVGDGPRRIAEVVARDLRGVVLDPASGRMLVDPSLFPDEDFVVDGPTDTGAQVLLATGVRPDEPRIAHVLVHAARGEAGDPLASTRTTDALLARASVAEGDANLYAIRYLFSAMGMADDVVRLGIDPGAVLDGTLLPAALGARGGSIDDLLQFVYRDGFDAVAKAYGDGGPARVAAIRDRAASTRDVLHPERIGEAVLAPAIDDAPEGMERVCTDTLGEQAVVVLISRGTGKDNLGLIAGDGWAGDTLVRWERPGAPDRARTVWRTAWRTEQDAADFAYAYRRVLEARFPGAIPPDTPAGGLTLLTGTTRWSLDVDGRSVEIRVDSSGSRPE